MSKITPQQESWEYLVVNHTDWIYEEQDQMNGHWLQDRLDKYGLEGWELCSVEGVHSYFKRRLQTKAISSERTRLLDEVRGEILRVFDKYEKMH